MCSDVLLCIALCYCMCAALPSLSIVCCRCCTTPFSSVEHELNFKLKAIQLLMLSRCPAMVGYEAACEALDELYQVAKSETDNRYSEAML